MNDILKSINLRLNNPFILSFCISWIFWNWPVVVGLIWYNSTTIEKFGYTDYKDLIHQNANPWKNYVLPAAFAIAYPFAKWYFAWIQTWVASKEEKTIKVVSGKGFIPTSKYLKIVDQYDADVLKLSEIIEKEGATEAVNANLRATILTKDNEIAENRKAIKAGENHIEKLKNRTDVKIFDGSWKIEIQEAGGKLILLKDFYLNDGSGYDYSQRTKGGVIKSTLVITSYILDPFTSKVSILLDLKDDGYFAFPTCDWNENFDKVTGRFTHLDPTLYFSMTKIK